MSVKRPPSREALEREALPGGPAVSGVHAGRGGVQQDEGGQKTRGVGTLGGRGLEALGAGGEGLGVGVLGGGDGLSTIFWASSTDSIYGTGWLDLEDKDCGQSARNRAPFIFPVDQHGVKPPQKKMTNGWFFGLHVT